MNFVKIKQHFIWTVRIPDTSRICKHDLKTDWPITKVYSLAGEANSANLLAENKFGKPQMLLMD